MRNCARITNMKQYIEFKLRDKTKRVKLIEPLPKTLEDRLMELPTAAAIVVGLVGFVGMTSMLFLAPNSLQLLKRLVIKKYHKKYNKAQLEQKFIQTVYYLKKTGVIDIGSNQNGFWIKLTQLGQKKHDKTFKDSFYVSKPKVWDETFWLVAADIPSKTHRLAGEALRRKLINANFYPLQRTLWLYPYNPTPALQALLQTLDTQKFVTLMHISELDAEDKKLAISFWKTKNML